MRFKRGVILVLLLLGCLCVPAGAVDGIDEAAYVFEINLRNSGFDNYTGQKCIEFDSDIEIHSFRMIDKEKLNYVNVVYFDHNSYAFDHPYVNGPYEDPDYYFKKPVKLSAGKHTVQVAIGSAKRKDLTVIFYGKGELSKPEPITPVFMVSTLSKELLTDTIHLDFSKSITDFNCSLIDASGVSLGLTTSVNGSVGTVQIMDKAFKAGNAYTLKVISATAEDGGTLEKPYSHTFEAVPEKPPEPPVKPPKPKLYLKSALPDYLLKNSISLEFSLPLKDISFQLLDASGQEVATQVVISGSSATVQIIDSAFQSGQPYTFKLLGATAEDGGQLENPISHSFKEMVSSGNQGFDMVFMGILSMFSESKTQGLIIVILAVFVGLIFVLGRWLWEMSKVWLRRAKY